MRCGDCLLNYALHLGGRFGRRSGRAERGAAMQFIVTGRSLDMPPVPLPQAVAMFKATWEHFASGSDPRIQAIYPHADERAVTFVVEVESAEDLSSLLRRLPVFPLV